MKGLKAPANSCRTSPTRRLTVEFELNHLALSYRTFLTEVVGLKQNEAQLLWEQFWPVVKASPSYTVRINGRIVVKRQFVVSKKTRKKIAALKRRRELERK